MQEDKSKLVIEIIRRLERVYPNKLELHFNNPFELLIAVILSAQTTDAKVNEITSTLFKKYSTPEDFLKVPIEELERDISSINYYRKKAKFIKGACQILVEKYSGEVPKSIEELTELPGIGRKSANMILYNAFGINEGIAVDTHVARVSKRLGLTDQEKPEKIEEDLMRITPKEEWGKLSNLLILHGRYICTAKNPKHKECVLYDLCPSRDL
ncbi:endonuclease III [Hydrogenobacter hydrogenophilus]|uniref:Endonuclease III n=1 Tax=Hydrogenobacter hydrogenophilus TaxID=35835 RepID=A0A285NQ02_9AQUI|nr:endonuclease III [Hydrogenobacter hydrogenophilus]SNZ11298.1 DNA-(apurinic or apyrimidinic site) lyase /endonuclease III [Hydrogenobacter hydrogenophilus]